MTLGLLSTSDLGTRQPFQLKKSSRPSLLLLGLLSGSLACDILNSDIFKNRLKKTIEEESTTWRADKDVMAIGQQGEYVITMIENRKPSK
jgi:hypothetical protein